MRRTLIFLLLAVMATATPVFADTNFGVGINQTTSTPASWIATVIEFTWAGSFGYWSSTSSILPEPIEGFGGSFLGDFTNYKHIRKVKLVGTSTRGQRFYWEASKQERKDGTFVAHVSCLNAGGWTWHWQVESKDKTVELQILFFSFNSNRGRSTEGAFHMFVKSPPAGLESMTKEQVLRFTTGITPSWSTIDPAVMAKQQAVAGLQQQVASLPPAQPAYVPPPAPAYVPPAPPAPNFTGVTKIKLFCYGRQIEILANLNAYICPTNVLVFKRSGGIVAEALVNTIVPNQCIEAQVYSGGNVCQGDAVSYRRKGGR